MNNVPVKLRREEAAELYRQAQEIEAEAARLMARRARLEQREVYVARLGDAIGLTGVCMILGLVALLLAYNGAPWWSLWPGVSALLVGWYAVREWWQASGKWVESWKEGAEDE